MPRLTRIGALIVAEPTQAKREILEALDATEGNRTRAAEALGVSLAMFHRWLHTLDMWEDVDALCDAKGYDVQPGPERKPSVKRRHT